ncbi:MAG: beta-ketoacyl-ACP synthase II [Candidatus Cloacimonetes bacterium]|nr:beta-ketoacyl-ACP synthase II [Candidatus Cloacimonadota bacterium]
MSKRRIVITGLGTLNALGNNVEDCWENLLAGKSGIRRIENFDAGEGFPSKIAGEVRNFDPKEHFERKQIKKMDKYTQFALVASRQAFKDAKLDEFEYDPERAGVLVSSGIGGMLTFEKEAAKLALSGPRRISPFFIPKMISNIASAEIAIEFNFKAANFNISSACASANHSIGIAYRLIQFGDADIMFAGGSEGSVTRLAVAGFSSMKALSTRNDEPEKSSRPFDKDRDGFVMAEGAGVLVLEELEHALKRGAKIYAEIVGFGATCDAYHITAPAENGEGGARAIKLALKNSGIEPNKIDYINAHGTSTPLNDINETIAIKTVFGEHAYKLKVNSTKSMTGHTLGAAAGIEAIVCCKSILTGKIHPTINLENPDPVCDLNYVAEGAIEQEIHYALSNSLGFGGHNAVVIFKKYE